MKLFIHNKTQEFHIGTSLDLDLCVTTTLNQCKDGDLELEFILEDGTKLYYQMTRFDFGYGGLGVSVLDILGLSLIDPLVRSTLSPKKAIKEARTMLNKYGFSQKTKGI